MANRHRRDASSYTTRTLLLLAKAQTCNESLNGGLNQKESFC